MKNKGITLVALVITIIILIILAGISISMLLDEDGLIAKVKRGAEDYKIAAQNELEILGIVNEQVNTLTYGTSNGVISGGSKSGLVASAIGFTPEDSTWTGIETVQDALDFLYNN